MARSIEALAPLARPVGFLPETWRVPLLGWLWVLFNISIVWLGITIGQSTICSIVVGGVDGTVIAVIAVAKASAKFQAATTGLIGGFGLNKVGSETNFLKTTADAIHRVVDGFMDIVDGGTCATCEAAHSKIEGAVLLIVWTAAFVILASLIGEWVRDTRSGNASN